MIHTRTFRFLFSVLLLLLLATVTACGSAAEPTQTDTQAEAVEETSAGVESVDESPAETAPPDTIILMSHDSFDAGEEVIAAFEEANNVKIEFLRSGDAGAVLNQAILSKENPLADVFFGVDNTFLSRALESGIFEPYESPQLAHIPDDLKLDPDSRLLPVDYGDVCLNYDKAWFADKGLAPPGSLEDLLKEEYSGLTVVENPATSSPGLAFLMATVVHFGDPGYLDYWAKLVEQDVLVVDGWTEAYYGEFSRYDGTRPIVVSYASSPPVEVYFAEEPLDDAPTASVLGDQSCFRQIEFIGILAGTQQRDLAEKLIDFLLSRKFQEDIPLKMFVFPANQDAGLPDVFRQYAELSPHPATLPPAEIAARREAWIEAWTETALR